MNTRPDERIHTLLTASLFGELDRSERAELEAALADSPELVAERDRLAATVGLVRESYGRGSSGEEPRLSDASVRRLVDQALSRRAGARPVAALRLLRSPFLRAAAAIVVLVGGVLGLLRLGGGAALRTPTTVARLDAQAASGRDSENSGRAQTESDLADARLGLELHGGGEPAKQSGRGERALESPAPAAPAIGGKDELAAGQAGSAPGEPAPRSGVPLDGDGAAVVHRYAFDQGQTDSLDSAVLSELFQKSQSPAKLDLSSSLDSPGAHDTLRVSPGVQPEEKAFGSEAFLAGASPASPAAGGPGALREPALRAYEQAAGELAALARRANGGAQPEAGAHRGPGDTVPPGGGVARSLGYSGDDREGDSVDLGLVLRSMGYAGDANEGVTTGSDEFYLGQGTRSRQGDVDSALERMRREGDEQGLRRYADEWYERLIRDCRPRPQERPRDMFFRYWGDNPFELSQVDSLSTFAVDVDTASYALARRYLADGHLPEKAQVRTEEFLNWFQPDLAPPAEGDFAIHTELAPSLFGGRPDRWMLRVGLRGRLISEEERKPLSLVFVVDTSGSMREDARLELVKHAMRLLVGELREGDRIGIVAFSNEARLILPVTPVAQRGLIESALHPLQPNGSTNAEGGLRMGYELLLGSLDARAVSRVVLLSDGVANVGETDQDRILDSVRQHRERGIYLNTIGVGMDNHNDVFLEQLADNGDGICDYVDSPQSAQRAIVERFTGAFQPIASDVKVQVEFDPARVHRWRLLGYENRAVADADFRNDAVDAGEIGAGHQVVALFELERAESAAAQAEELQLATVRLRWKAPKAPGQDPREVDVSELEAPVFASAAAQGFGQASVGYRRSVLVAQFAEFLRRSTHTEGDRYSDLVAACDALEREHPDPELHEFAGMVRRAADLILEEHRRRFELRSELDRALDAYRERQIRRAELECLELEGARDLLERLQRENEQLERELRELVRRRVMKG